MAEGVVSGEWRVARTTDGDRLARAMGVAGLSAGQLARLYTESRTPRPRPYCIRRRIDGILSGEWGFAEDLAAIRLAELLDCDPRWLATGEPSPAARAWWDAVTRAATVYARRTDVLRQCCELLALTPQPRTLPGICCYCGCTEEHGCAGGCFWLDERHTVCSACLEMEARA